MIPSDRDTALLLLIVAVGLALRLWGIDFGLPYSYANDEYHEVMRALELGSGRMNLERTGKGGFYFVLLVEYGVYFLWLKLVGVVDSAADFALEFVRDPSAFYFMGRFTAAVIGASTIAIVFCLTRKAYSVRAALLAAVLLCVNTLHIDLSHRIGVDVPMTCLATAALLFAVRIAENGSAADYRWGALFAALAMSTKLPGIVLIVPLLLAHTYHVRAAGGGSGRWLLNRDLWLAAVLFAAVVVITNPGILLHSNPLALFLDGSGGDASDVDEQDSGDMLYEGRPNLFTFYLWVLLQSMGWPLFLVALGSVAYALWRRTPADLILISFALVFYLLISITTSEILYYPRYVLPVLAVLTILSGRLLGELWQMSRLTHHPAVALTIIVALIAVPTVRSVQGNQLLAGTDTRTLAKEWMEAHVPQGAKVFIEGLKIKPIKSTAQLKDSAENIRRRIEYWKPREPKQARFLELELQVLEGKTFDLELVRRSEIRSFAHYESVGVEYFVVRPDALLKSRRSDQQGVLLLRALRSDSRVSMVQGFYPDRRRTPGPIIEVYRLKRPAEH